MEIKYGSMGVDINYINLKKNEIKKALKTLDENMSQITRITFVIDDKEFFIYNDKFSGKKSISKEYTNKLDEALEKAVKGKAKDFISLYNKIKELIK